MSFRDRLRSLVQRGEQADDQSYPDDQEVFLTHGGRKRRYLVHLPSGYDGRSPLPVVLSFHGGMARAEIQRRQSGMNDVADEHGFMVVYPDGTGLTSLLTFNAGTCCGYAVRTKVDDVGFTRAMLDDLESRYSVDKRRVYASGFSNGAMLCYRLACELSDRIAAIGAVSGDMGVNGPVPDRPVPIIHFHGLKDENSPFRGGVGENQFQPNPHRSIPDTIGWWIKVNHCQGEPQSVKGVPDAELAVYAPAEGRAGASIELYTMPEGGHAWPGGAEVGAHLNLGLLVESVDASQLMWKFFESHPMPE